MAAATPDTLPDWAPDFGTLDAAAPTWAAKRPMRIALLGDFSAGACSGRLDDRAALMRRKPMPVEFDTLEDTLARLDVKLSLPLGDEGSPVTLGVSELESFHPDSLYRELELFHRLADLRKRLNNTATFAKAADELHKMAGGSSQKTTHKPSRTQRERRSRGASPAAHLRLNDFARLTGRPSAGDAVEANVQTLMQAMISPFIVPAPQPEKTALLATMDAAITDVMRAVLHHPEFQNTESLWRGVDFLLRRIETGPMLQVHLFDISAEEMAADLGASQDLSDTALHRLLVASPSEQRDGGYAAIAGLYQFEATPVHAELLGRMATIASAAGAPFLTGGPIDAWADARKPPHALVQGAFAALRALPQAAHLALFGPRFMLRHPYGKHSDPISSFSFEEFTVSDGLRGMLWGHPALLALTALFGQSGVATVDDLPFHHMVDADGDGIALPCTERFVSSDSAARLHAVGITALMAHRGEPRVRLAGLDAMNGQPLNIAGLAVQPARKAVDRIALGSALRSAAGQGKASSPAKAGTQSSDDSDTSDSSDTALDADSSSESTGDDLDALLASMNSTSESDSAASDAAPEPDASSTAMDADLEALLNSLK